jgi:hypothetical protein
MGWQLQCLNPECKRAPWVNNIVDLILNHRDPRGFVCSCGRDAFVAKRFDLQEPDKVWAPYLRGAIPLGEAGSTYQPFAFLVSSTPEAGISDVWLSYYKDLRQFGGRLKLGYGPGGPPGLGKAQLLELLIRLVAIGAVEHNDLKECLARKQPNPCLEQLSP